VSDQTVEFLYQNRQKLADVEKRLAANTRLGSLDLLQVLVSHLQLQESMQLLDVGCGPGQHLAKIAARHDLRLYGIDPSIDGHRDPTKTLLRGTAERLPFVAGAFDRVMCNYALYYVDAWQQAINEMLRICHPQGRIVISGPATDNNQAFYGLHRRLFGEISAIDLHALRFITLDLEPYLQAQSIPFRSQVYENKIVYRQETDFIDYYTSTSLFRMTSQNQDAAQMIQKIRAAVHPTYTDGRTFDNTKNIKILTLYRS
jgi:ubiquinone/menaquinone biosynthesis C-methylase UbiE